NGHYQLVVLDLMLPGEGGLDFARWLRTQSDVPIVMLTAMGEETDRIIGLELGADDYVPKPFSPRELLARLRAVLRRSQPAVKGERLVVGDVALDLGTREVTVRGDVVELTGLEFDLLVALARRAGRVIPRDALLE